MTTLRKSGREDQPGQFKTENALGKRKKGYQSTRRVGGRGVAMDCSKYGQK